jgi:hypothetical protein
MGSGRRLCVVLLVAFVAVLVFDVRHRLCVDYLGALRLLADSASKNVILGDCVVTGAESLSSVLTALSIADSAELFAPHWEESVAALAGATPWLLAPDRIQSQSTDAALPDEAVREVLRVAQLVSDDPDLRLLLWHCCRLLYEHLDYPAQMVTRWPNLDQRLGKDSPLFYFLLTLASVCLARQKHEELGIPGDVACANAKNVFGHGERQVLTTGRWGTEQRLLPWMRNHTTGELFRLGRLHFMIRPFRGCVRAFRNRESGAVAALAVDGTRFVEPGILLHGKVAEGRRAWVASFSEDGDGYHGVPVSPWGYACEEEITLDRSGWEPALTPGDPMIEVHIPGGGGMTVERVRDAMTHALDFFPRYFPERPFVGFVCTSWVFNARFSEILPPEANIRQNQEQVYLYPVSSGGRDGVYFIFGTDVVDPATSPRDTSIQRVMLSELEAERPLLTGGMFLLLDDFSAFGKQAYRGRWPFEVG